MEAFEVERYKDTTSIARFIRLYEDEFDNCAGGSLHIVLSDENTGDSSVRFCLDWAKAHEDPLGVALAELLLNIPEDKRIEAINISRSMNPSWHSGFIGEGEEEAPRSYTATGTLLSLTKP